jgi:hypothetical protein
MSEKKINVVVKANEWPKERLIKNKTKRVRRK